MSKRPPRKTLFFIKGVAPSEEERKKAEAIPGLVAFRNVNHIHENDAIEDFDDVEGAVPDNYAEAAAEKAAQGGDKPPEPKAKASAPAAPQKAAKPAQGGNSGAWKANS